LNRIVAVKMILVGQWASEEHIERFQLEAEAAANLDHPGIVPTMRSGSFDGQHYFSMKLIEGGACATLIARGDFRVDGDGGKGGKTGIRLRNVAHRAIGRRSHSFGSLRASTRSSAPRSETDEYSDRYAMASRI
jgi:serine/threonine protein kinase